METKNKQTFSKEEREVILQKTKYKCAHCGKKLSVATMTADHIFPRSKGGLDDEYNLLPLCYDCNEKKSNYVYRIKDFYKHINPDEIDTFEEYSNFVTYEYCKQTILGYDETIMSFIPDRNLEIIEQMEQRGASKKKIADMYLKLRVPMTIRKAWPGDAIKIHNAMVKYEKVCKPALEMYPHDTAMLNAISNGIVYILEKNNDICGVFIFEPYNIVIGNNDIPLQLKNIIDHTGLQLKYVMTCAMINKFAYQLFNDLMIRFERMQKLNGWIPLYLSVLTMSYSRIKECISMPWDVKGSKFNLEFMQYKEMIRSLNDSYQYEFEYYGYEPDEYDLKLFSEYLMTKNYWKDFEDDEEAEDFFKRFPAMKYYFKPESYKHHNVGFPTLKNKTT